MRDFRNLLLRNHIAPKWLIFSLDLAICILAIIYANYLLFNLNLIVVDIRDLLRAIFLTALFNSIFFFLLKTYSGIIRFSDFHEAVRSITAVFCSFVGMLMFNVFLSIFRIPLFLPNTALFIYFFIASFLLFGYRLLVKNLYRISINEVSFKNVVIYGAGLNASLLMKTIEQIANGQYKVVAFVDDDERLIGKTIDNIEIYSYQNLSGILDGFHIRILFFARQNIDFSFKNSMVDICLEKHVKVMNIPPINRWMQGHLSINQLEEVKIDELLGRPVIQLNNQHMINQLRNKRILITGAAGSIGSELARQLAAIHPLSLILCDQRETGLYDLEYELQQKFNLGNSLKVCLSDVKDEHSMNQLFKSNLPNIVFHAAAYKHVPIIESHPSEAIRNNVLGTKVVADLSELYQVERFLLVSTDKAINPTNIMGASKRIAEIYCHSLHSRDDKSFYSKDPIVYQFSSTQKRTKFITTRFGNVLGSNGSVIPRFKQQIAKGGPVTVTHPDIIRYFMTIEEACSLVVEAAIMGNGGEVFLFDMGKPIKIIDLANKMIRLEGFEPGKDIEVRFTGLRPGEKLFEELLNNLEEVMPTHHKKILIAKLRKYNHEIVFKSIHHLLDLAEMNNDDDVVRQMKKIIPEFISNNSIYEMMDYKILSKTVSS